MKEGTDQKLFVCELVSSFSTSFAVSVARQGASPPSINHENLE